MNFVSDNLVGASRQVLEAILRANEGAISAYGADPISKRVEATFARVFEKEVAVFPVATGTAANALAVAAAVPPWGLAISHGEAHVIDDECGAPEFFTHGAKLAGLPGVAAKIAPATLSAYLAGLPNHVKQMPPKLLSISQVTECGTLYTLEEIRDLSRICREHGMALHMDGARFANALVALGCTPAEMTWKAGVDILSFGGTKNGCLMAEAVVVFDPVLAESLAYRRKRAGQVISKARLIAAQFEAYFADDHWHANARHANRMAKLLSDGLAGLPGVRLAWPTEANEVFPILSRTVDACLLAAGADYRTWTDGSLAEGERVREDERLVRLVTSFATTEDEVRRFLEAARGATRREAAE